MCETKLLQVQNHLSVEYNKKNRENILERFLEYKSLGDDQENGGDRREWSYPILSNHQKILYEVLSACHRLCEQNRSIVTMWTPAHVVILSNERTDRLAKETIKKVDIDMQMCKSTENGMG